MGQPAITTQAKSPLMIALWRAATMAAAADNAVATMAQGNAAKANRMGMSAPPRRLMLSAVWGVLGKRRLLPFGMLNLTMPSLPWSQRRTQLGM